MTKRLLIATAVLGVLLRIIPIWTRQPWYDENFTIILARLPLSDLLAATAWDVHPPLWYLLCWPLAHLNLPGWAICRIPALLASLASLWVFWQILRETATSPRVRTAAFVLFALLPTQIYYAQEGRQYALLTLLFLLGWLCILRRQWLGLFVSALAMLYLHNYGILYAAALWLAGLVHGRGKWRQLTLALLAAGILFLPWVFLLFRQMTEIRGAHWMVHFTAASALSDIAHAFWSKSTSLAAIILNFTVFWGILGWSLIHGLRTRTLNLPAVLLAFIPPLLAVIGSLLWQPIMLFRALVPIGAFLVLIIAAPLDWLSQFRWRLYLAGFFLLPALLTNIASTSIRHLWPDTDIEAPALEYIAAHWQPGDLIYHNYDGLFVAAEAWQALPPGAEMIRLPECGTILGGLSPETRRRIGEIEAPLPADAGRVWTFALESPHTPACEYDQLQALGLLDAPPVLCTEDDKLILSCLYLVEK